MKQHVSPQQHFRRITVGALSGILAAASLAAASLFADPGELLAPGTKADVSQGTVSIISSGKLPAGYRGVHNARFSWMDKLRNWLLSLSPVVRGMTLLPLWCVGKAGLLLLSGLCSAFSPLFQTALPILLNGLLLLGIVFLLDRLCFPGKPFRRLLRKETLLPLACCALALGFADGVLRRYWPDYAPISAAIKAALGLLSLLLLSWLLFINKSHFQQKREVSTYER